MWSGSILLAGGLWGLMGLFSREMAAIGFSPFGVILMRCGVGALFFGLAILMTDPKRFRIKLKDLWVFFGCGILSLLFFNACYFQAINLMSLSAAAILLYTAPSLVILMSAVFFKERITSRKVFALLLAFAGCCLTSGIIGADIHQIGVVPLLFGLGSGLGYALYSIFSKVALQKGYHTMTINFYACVLAAVGSGLVWGVREPLLLAVSSGYNIGFCIVLGFVTFFLPYLLYTLGLGHMETGKAAIMASVEPVVATIMGIVVYREMPTVWSAIGIVVALAAIVLLNLPEKNKCSGGCDD